MPSNRRIQPRKHNVTILEMLGLALRDHQVPDPGGHRRGLLPIHSLSIRLALRSLRRPHRDELKVRMLGQEEGKPLSYAAGAAQHPAFSLRKARRFGRESHDDDLLREIQWDEGRSKMSQGGQGSAGLRAYFLGRIGGAGARRRVPPWGQGRACM